MKPELLKLLESKGYFPAETSAESSAESPCISFFIYPDGKSDSRIDIFCGISQIRNKRAVKNFLQASLG